MAKNDMTHRKLCAFRQPLGIGAHPEPLELEAHKSPLLVSAHDEVAAAPVAAASVAGSASMKWGVFAAILGLALVVAGFLFFANNRHIGRTPSALTASHWDKAVKAFGSMSGEQSSMQIDKATEADIAVPSIVDKVVYLFNYDSSGVQESDILNKVADRASASGENVTVKAYTDPTGNTGYNRRLSARRAKAVGDYLVAHGVSASRVKTIGMGATDAFSDDAHDRRAEITFE